MNINKIVLNNQNINYQIPRKALTKAYNQAPDFNGSNKFLGLLDNFAASAKAKIASCSDIATASKIRQLKNSAACIIQEDFKLENGKIAKFDIFKGTRAGSNEGFYALNKESGELFYTKFGTQGGKTFTSQPEVEVLASKIYNLAGLDTSDMQLIQDKKGRIGLLSKYIPDLKPVHEAEQKINEGFGTDIFLANWDSVISNNIQKCGKKLYRIDFGGSLNYRAQGAEKEFGKVVNELTTMVDPHINYGASYLFSTMTRDDLIKSLERVVNLDNNELHKIVKKYTNADGKNLYQTLIQRKNFLGKALEEIKATPCQNNVNLEYLEKIKSQVLKKI